MREERIPFSVKLREELNIVRKIYKFSKLKKSNSYRMVLPKEVCDQLKIGDDTHYVVAYSPGDQSIVVPFFNFDEVVELKPKEGGLRVLYDIKMEGYLLSGIRKVWRSIGKAEQHGITLPPTVVRDMKINQYTLFIMGYSVKSRLLYLELRSMFEEIQAELVPYANIEQEIG